MTDRIQTSEVGLAYIRVHGLDLVPRGCTQHLDDLDQLVNSRLSWEERLSQHQFGHDTSS